MRLAPKIGTVLLLTVACAAGVLAQQPSLSLKVELVRDHAAHKPGGTPNASGVVVWLEPVKADATATAKPRGGYVLTQKNRQFTPHLLVVSVGSSVEFPNLDPFFHNVFSLFNGKRFDLGLYESNSHRSVRFDREGVSYIFCNIHPEMAAVVVALRTPYYAVSSTDGTISLHDIPAGTYKLKLWAENVSAARLAAAERTVQIAAGSNQLGAIAIETNGETMTQHMNKFGDPYKPLPKDPY